MSAGRFKSKDDYFTKRSGFAERIISVKPQRTRRRMLEPVIPVTLLRVPFCKTVDSFEIAGKGRFRKGEYPLDDALRSHLDGEATMLVNPLSHAGETAFTVVRFDLSEEMDHPFSRARQFAEELWKRDIPSQIEVTEGGKGHYHLWIFHEEPILAWRFSDSLIRFGRKFFGVFLETAPSVRGEEYIPLPLQGESVLLQRRVFVNSVGKMIRDQGNVLRTIKYCPKRVSASFIEMISPVHPPALEPEAPVSQGTPSCALHNLGTPTARPGGVIRAESTPKPPVSPPAPGAERTPPVEERKPAPTAGTPSTVSHVPGAPGEERKPGAKPLESAAVQPKEYPKVSPPSILLVFIRRGKEYGVEPARVKGIYPMEGITVVPGMGGCTYGMKRIGEMGVTVLDIGMPAGSGDSTAPVFGRQVPKLVQGTGWGPRIVALGSEFSGYGFLADRVPGIVAVSGGVFTPLETDEYVGGMLEFSGGARRILFPDMNRICRTLQVGPSGKDRTPDEPERGDSYVVFTVGGESYAVPARAVERILSAGQSGSGQSAGMPAPKRFDLRVPQLAPCTSWEPRPAMDSGADGIRTGGMGGKPGLGTPHKLGTPWSRTLVVSHGNLTAEVPVDRIEGVRRISSASLDRFPRPERAESPVRAVARFSGKERPVFILDPEFICR
jgi:chemotaxis signal transduction protein